MSMSPDPRRLGPLSHRAVVRSADLSIHRASGPRCGFCTSEFLRSSCPGWTKWCRRTLRNGSPRYSLNAKYGSCSIGSKDAMRTPRRCTGRCRGVLQQQPFQTLAVVLVGGQRGDGRKQRGWLSSSWHLCRGLGRRLRSASTRERAPDADGRAMLR